jgi:NAD(P)-dependent dehydrogenase (short-subunit alcohol dehydrogenase family)
MGSKYAAAHESPKGPGDARPTALQIIEDEQAEGQLTGKVILITGCSSGLGVETARTLYKTGATLYLTGRDVEKAKTALSDIVDSPRVHLLKLDLTSLASVHACAKEFKSKSKQLNILIENAGVMACPEGRTVDGFETQFGTNYLAQFLLFYLLKPTLLASSTPDFESRVVIVASSSHRMSSVHFDNLSLEGEYEPYKAYGQSKTACVWTANEIERRYGSKGLHAFSLHPGGIRTELLRHVTAEQQAEWDKSDVVTNYWKSPQQGAATTVWAAVARELEGKGGKYLDNCQIAGLHNEELGRYAPGYAPWAYDTEGAKKLWEIALETLDLKDE